MMLRCLALASVAALGRAAGAPPKGSTIAASSNVVWTDPTWKSDGTGAMPIGNGDATSSVWVDEATGDLRLLVSKSDVFDENSQPVKTGVLRLSFDPPLWKPAAPPTPTKTECKPAHAGQPLSAFEQKGGAGKTSTICDQQALMKGVAEPNVPCNSSDIHVCAALAAQACCATSGCVSFSINPAVGWGTTHAAEFCSTTRTNVGGTPGPGWTTWTMIGAPVAPPAPSPAPATCAEGAAFCQTLHVSNSTVTIKTKNLDVSVFYDLNAPLRDGEPHRDSGILHVTARSTPTSTEGAGFGLKVALEPYRVAGKPTNLGRGLCFPRFEQADTIVEGTKDAITWYHWNHINTTYYNDTMHGQGVDPACPGCFDMFTHRAFGGTLAAEGLRGSGESLIGTGLTSVDVELKLLTLMVEQPSTFLSELAKISPAPPMSETSMRKTSTSADDKETPTTWAEIMDRSYIQLSASGGPDAVAAKQITDHVNWDRYLSLIQGRAAFAPIKFNGQSFNCNDTGKGWDYRSWGADYWWQNERQPYYNVLAQGDFDTMRSFLDFYLRMLPYVEARTKVQFSKTSTPLTAGAFYEETCTQFGLYNEGDWGCSTKAPAPNGASSNSYIRFHYTGALELSLMVLDHFDATGDMNDLKKYLPMAAGVVEAFRQRFPKKDANGKIDMWPAQALETYQCHDPTSRASCPTNPSTDIGGLLSVLPRLIALPSEVVTPTQVQQWKAHLASLPPLPLASSATNGTYNKQKIAPVAKGDGFPTSGRGQRSNSENTELYVSHPFRLYGVGKKTDITLAQQAYAERHSPCNDGWCQDIIQAAMLNLTDEATAQLAQRAAAGPAKNFRFPGFAQHYQDYEPSLDHFGFMRTGLDYMLMAPLDDAARSMLLFPTFPTAKWDVRFKMHAPLNTTIEASCQGGKLEYLIVTPPERKKDITVLNCEPADQ